MLAGERLGKYRLTRRLGDGAMGEVWAAINERTHGEVALKLLPDPNPELRARMLREARACGSLRHPHIVEIYDVGETESGDPFLVMELLSGETLAERLARQRRLPPPLAAAIACAIARALRAAHAKGIVHRDLKPANVFLHREADVEAEQVKVLDFGVSKNLVGDDATATATGFLVGSPAYMSPEQARGDKDIDQRSDLWSLGVVLFEMIAGCRPFPNKSPYVAIAEVLGAPIPKLSEKVPGVSPGLSSVVELCLTREVASRVASADELLVRLRPFAEELVATGDSPSRTSFAPNTLLPASTLQIVDPEALPPTEVLKVDAYPVPAVPAPRDEPSEAAAVEPPAQGTTEEDDDQRPTAQPALALVAAELAAPEGASDVVAAASRERVPSSHAIPAAPRFGAPPLEGPGSSHETVRLAPAESLPGAEEEETVRRGPSQLRPIVLSSATASSSTTPLIRAPAQAPIPSASPPSSRVSVALLGAGVGVAALMFVTFALWQRPSKAPPEASVAASAATDGPSPERAPEPPATPDPTAPAAEGSAEPTASAAPRAEPQENGKRTWLNIRSDVAARVFLDGHQIGVTPLVPIVVLPGPHKVVFRRSAPGEAQAQERVVRLDAKAGEISYATVTFGAKPSRGRANPTGL